MNVRASLAVFGILFSYGLVQANAATVLPHYALTENNGIPSRLTFNPNTGPGAFVTQVVTNIGTTTLEGANYSVTDNISLGPAPYISASGTSSAGGLAQAKAYLSYYFAISGPTGAVPVHVEAAGSAFGGGSNAIFIVERTIATDPTPRILGQASPGHEEFQIAGFYNFQANMIYRVTLEAFGTAHNNAFFAWVDPTFTIDPNFSSNYSLSFSEGIQNGVAAVPGPIVGAGLPGLVMALGGFVAWRRRRNQVAAV